MQSLVGLLLASLIVASATALYVPRIGALERERFDRGSATQFRVFAEAAQRFLEEEREALSNRLATDPGPHSFDAAALIAARALQPGFRDTNTFRQNHGLIVRSHPLDARHVEGIAVTYAGEDILPVDIDRLALDAGERTGFVRTDRPGEIWGASGLWNLSVADFTGGTVPANMAPSAGHLAAYLSTFTPEREGRSVMRSLGMHAAGDRVPKPLCGAATPSIYIVPVQFSDNGAGYPILGMQGFAEHSADNLAWIIRLEVFREDPARPGQSERVTPDATHGRVAVFTACE